MPDDEIYMTICDECSEEIPADEANDCECGGVFCNECAAPYNHDCLLVDDEDDSLEEED